MKALIQDSLRGEPIDGRFEQDQFDLTGPDGRIILPRLWHSTIQPGWTITMQMWQTSVLAPDCQQEPERQREGERERQQQEREQEQRQREREQREREQEQREREREQREREQEQRAREREQRWREQEQWERQLIPQQQQQVSRSPSFTVTHGLRRSPPPRTQQWLLWFAGRGRLGYRKKR